MDDGPSAAAGPPVDNEPTSAEIRNRLTTPGFARQLSKDDAEATMRKRLAGASSWNGFFKEVAVKLVLFAVLLLVLWAVSGTR